MDFLAVQIGRFVDPHQPGVVACEFVDADGCRHTLIDKVPIFSIEDLDASSTYPRPGAVRCTVVSSWRDERGRGLVRLNTARPDRVDSTEGLSEFVVWSSQVSTGP